MRVFVQGSLQSDGRYDTVPCSKTISIKMLLTHTSGLSYAFDQKGVVNQLDKLYADQLPGSHSHAASSHAASSHTAAVTLLPLTLLLSRCCSHTASSHAAALTLLHCHCCCLCLLSHEVYALTGRGLLGGGGVSLGDFCDSLAELPLLFEPGTAWHYGFNTDVRSCH